MFIYVYVYKIYVYKMRKNIYANQVFNIYYKDKKHIPIRLKCNVASSTLEEIWMRNVDASSVEKND